MLEKDIESKGCKYAKEHDVEPYKFTSPNRAAVPDRLFLKKVPAFLRPVIARYVCFVEVKQEGKKPTKPQEREHQRLTELGYRVYVADSVEKMKEIVNGMGGYE